MEASARATRTTVFAAIFLAALMLGVPSALTGGNQIAATDNAAAADGTRQFIVGGIDLVGSIATLNPFLYTSAGEMMTIWPCMSTVLTYDVDGNLIGDIAQSWSSSPDGLTWYFKLEPNIYFTDPANPTDMSHKLTWDDIRYTLFQAQDYTNNLQSYFRYLDQGVIANIYGSNATNWCNITLTVPFAPFLGALSSVPIIPRYYWEPHETASGDATGWTGALPVGSGPWYYGLTGLPTTGDVLLKRSTHWFQEANRGWQVHVDSLTYRTETDAASAWNDLKLGNIDVFMGVPPSVFVADLPTEPTLIGWAQSTGFVYEYNLCQMTDQMRTDLGAPFTTGENSQLLLDPVIKRAMAMAVDKQGFVNNALSGLGTKADSLVPDVNPWHYTPENQVSFDIAGANALLDANDYPLVGGVRQCGPNSPAVLAGLGVVGEQLSFRFATLDNEPQWQIGAVDMQNWASLIGVQLNLVIKTYNQISQDWASADYDTWLWDWWFSPTSDPSTDVMSVLTTMELGSWQDLYWSNATFDAIYNRSLVAMDPTARRALTNELQQMAYDNMGCQLVAYRKELYAAWIGNWGGYGDWSSHYLLMPDYCAPYLYMQISPNGTDETNPNTAPNIASLQQTVTAYKGESQVYAGSATDSPGETLNYQWYWGDGTSSSGWLTSGSASHTYAKDGVYTAWFAAKETVAADHFISVKPVRVTVIDLTNTAPHDLSISYVPTSPDTGDTITFTGSAIDDNGDTLFYSWNFGDTFTAQGAVATHQYTTAGSYSVTLSVTDNHVGTQPRPVTKTILVTVIANRAPTITVPAYPNVNQNLLTQFSVTASDPDGDALRYTWDWGDLTPISVTTTPYATHTYTFKKTYTLTVSADDLTGLAGHNVTGSNTVTVQTATPHPPVVVSLTASPTTAEIGQAITFTAVGSDPDGGVLRFTFTYATGVYDVFNSASTLPNQQVTFSPTHSYATLGTKTVYVSVLDSTGLNTTSSGVAVEIVLPNYPPEIVPLDPYSSFTGTAVSFAGDAIDPDDVDLRYTWSFGDGSALMVGQSVSYAYSKAGTFTVTLYVDDLTGLSGHNVTATTTATIGYQLSLVAGWQMITLPLAASYTANTLPGLTMGDQIVGWDSATQAYSTFIKGITPSIYDFPIVGSLGYWVMVSVPKTLNLYGETPTAAQFIEITVPDGGAWVMIGLCTMRTDLTASIVPTLFSAGITIVAGYNPVTQTYTTWISAVPMVNNFALLPGCAYWVMASASGLLAYTP